MNSPVKTFPKELLKDILAEDTEDFELLEETLVESTRWSLHYEAIFKEVATGKTYRTGYSTGATECQDESPYEYDADDVAVHEVEQIDVVVKQWVAVKRA